MTLLDDGQTTSTPPLDTREDTNESRGQVYDDERALHHVLTATGLDEETVRAVLRSRDRYHLGLGVYPEELALEGESPEGIRADHPDLFPPHHVAWRFVDYRLEAEYVAIDSGMADADVRMILTVDRECTRRGLTD